ncbi:glycine/D-amino acid oxidase-like deaminating enzyme [Frondihabitans sp. PhB188]|uniref:FAD-dependent oxidoreductase n=1 Tax=Frondihabitans sp. PhB188 TaxID=2485200 RepID=UPI000F4682FA|nr:FAD-dependent oxidoreductase [Frondihabitans sp. PhB188]ROQ38240.1 glycine/D-amino acid oxidase-like deaminating enzyme [Frondihabitans sp. PhB188]
MTSIWLDKVREIPTDEFEPLATYDDVVIGAGLTGLVTALLFARRGHTVAVLEAGRVGGLATASSSAMVSRLQGAQLQKIRRRTYQSVVDAYVAGTGEAFDWLLGYAADAGVDVERRDAYSYATDRRGLARVDAEYLVGRRAGLDLEKTVDVDAPFATIGAVRLRDQAQLDPLDLVAALAADLRALGGVIVENARVTGVDAGDPATTHTALGDVSSERVHLTTGAPILDRGLYFAKIAPRRSFGLAFSGIDAAELPDAMYQGVDDGGRSVRSFGSQLIVGGGAHGVGRASSEAQIAHSLERWTRSHWPTAHTRRVWSGQDYATPHGVPFVGSLPRGRGRIYLATGYDSWGMTGAVSAARMLVSDVVGDNTPWMTTIHHRVTTPVAIGAALGENAAVAWSFARGWGRALTNPLLPGEIPSEGHGRVGIDGFTPVARSTVEGETCTLSAVCPHLAGVVTWNDQELTWDCPLHGSRFTRTGEVIEGPAGRGLARHDD